MSMLDLQSLTFPPQTSSGHSVENRSIQLYSNSAPFHILYAADDCGFALIIDDFASSSFVGLHSHFPSALVVRGARLDHAPLSVPLLVQAVHLVFLFFRTLALRCFCPDPISHVQRPFRDPRERPRTASSASPSGTAPPRAAPSPALASRAARMTACETLAGSPRRRTRSALPSRALGQLAVV